MWNTITSVGNVSDCFWLGLLSSNVQPTHVQLSCTNAYKMLSNTGCMKAEMMKMYEYL